MGTTGAPWNIPYADPSDLVRAWPELSEDVAEAVADGLNTRKLGQIIQTVKTDTFSTTSVTFVAVTGLSVSITPSSNTSKVLVLANVNTGGSGGDDLPVLRLMRDATPIYIGDASSSLFQGFGGHFSETTSGQGLDVRNILASQVAQFLDSPATTSSVTYSIEAVRTAGTAYVNRSGNDSSMRSASSITVIEVSA